MWMHQYLPENIDDWQKTASGWLLENARYFSDVGRDSILFLIHLIVGMVIGGMVALHPAMPSKRAPLAHALSERVAFLGLAFRRIVFSQVRISALNTFLTGIFLGLVMPILGYELPLVKTMIAVTFFVGLLPIIGNIISNTVIFLISLSVAPMAAVVALGYLIGIHKLEYFVNAKIIGTQIRARAWEILLALLVMDAAFGIAGLVAAPIYYAYLKDELSAKKLI
jgi:predicted PurR-regulated permease PerM